MPPSKAPSYKQRKSPQETSEYSTSLCTTETLRNARQWSEMTLNYQMMEERYPNLKEEVGGSNSVCEISFVPDGKLVKWSTTSCISVFAYWPMSPKKKKRKRNARHDQFHSQQASASDPFRCSVSL